MLRKWAVVLPLLVGLNKVSLQPITEDIVRGTRQLDLGDCCPCPDPERSRFRDRDGFSETSRFRDEECPCQPRGSDSDASASMLLPALRAIQPFVKQAEEKTDPKLLLQPEVGLASSVLETLREATDEEYQDALARDAARSAIKIIESDLSALDDTLTETPKKIVKIFLNPKDEMDDNLPEPSHVQETRCIHSPLQRMGQLRMNRPTPVLEGFDSPRKPLRKLKNKGLLHKNIHDMDSGFGASNIKERVSQPNADNTQQSSSLISNPSLFDIFSQNNLEKRDDSHESSEKMNLKSILEPKKFKPKLNMKLKDIIDNLNITSNKDKPKWPVIDFKKYFVTTTKLPPLKLTPLEHPIFKNNGQPQLKDLFKLKDVELIPREDLIKSKLIEKSSSNDPILNDNPCIDDNTDENIPTISQPLDTIPSATNLNSVILEENSDSIDDSNNNMNPDSTDCRPIFVDNDMKSISSETVDLENQSSPSEDITESEVNKNLDPSLEHSETHQSSFESTNAENEGNINSEETLAQHDQSSNEKQQANNDEMETTNAHKFDNNEDTANDESANNIYEIELFEDLNQLIAFDNSSFVSEVDSNDSANNEENQEQLREAIEETSNNELLTVEQNYEPRSFLKTTSDCIPQDTSSQISNSLNVENNEIMFQDDLVEDPTAMSLENINNGQVSENLHEFRQIEDLHSAETNQEITETKKESLEDGPNSLNIGDRNTLSNLKEDSSQVSYRDLQEMSDSILNLSECASIDTEDSRNINNNFSKALIVVHGDQNQMSNSLAPSSEIGDKTNLKGIKSEDVNDTNDHESTTGNCDQDINTSNNFDTGNNDFDITQNEMTAAASESECNVTPFTNLKSALSNTKPKIITNPTTDKNNILKVNKHAKILESLKTKFENLFTTTEKVPKNNMASNLEDTVNESSNTNPTIVRLDESKPLNKLHRTSQKLLRESSPPKVPVLNYKNKLPLPKYLNQKMNLKPIENSRIATLDSPIITPIARKEIPKEGRKNVVQAKRPQKMNLSELRNTLNDNKLKTTPSRNVQNSLESPLDLTRPFEDIFNPSSLTTFSDKLHSHTENSLQNIKDTLETRLRETQSVDLFSPNTIDTQDILESISSRRDEFNEKLQAIHSDFNDRFSTFQQSLLDQLNVPSNRNSEINGNGSNFGFRSNYNPLQSPHRELFRSNSLAQQKNNLNIPNDSLSRRFKSHEKPRFPASEAPDLNQNVENKRPDLIFEKNHFLNLKEQLPFETIKDRKSSLRKLGIPSTTTKKAPLIPRPKFFKTKIDLEPTSFSDTSYKAQAKHPSLPEEKLSKDKPLLTKPSRKNVVSKDPETERTETPTYISLPRSKLAEITVKTNKEEPSDDESETESPLEKLRKALQHRNHNKKISNGLKIPGNNVTPRKLITKDFAQQDSDLVGIKGGTRLRDNDLKKINEHLLMDTTHAAANNVERLQIVEPLRENVPYKCKLICYKDI